MSIVEFTPMVFHSSVWRWCCKKKATRTSYQKSDRRDLQKTFARVGLRQLFASVVLTTWALGSKKWSLELEHHNWSEFIMTIPNVSIPKPVFHVPIVLCYHKISSIHKALLHQMHALCIENGAGIYCTGQQSVTLCFKIQSLFILELEWQLQIINLIGKHKTGIECIM